MMGIEGHQQQDYHIKCTGNRIFTEVHRDRTEKCVGNRTGKYARKRRDTEVHQKQDRQVCQMENCTRNRTEKFTRNRANTEVHQKLNKRIMHQKQDKNKSAPKTGQAQRCIVLKTG